MAEVTAQKIKELRERTQVGMSDCKAALVESDGDMDKAVELLLKRGATKSVKNASAAATEGEVRAHVQPDGKSGVIVEVNSQTDFVARNDDFRAFVDGVVSLASHTKAGGDLLAQTVPGTGKTLEDARKELTGKIGENIQVRRWDRFDVEGHGLVHSYVHAGGKIGVLLELRTSAEIAADNPALRAFADDTAMQIAAMSARHVDRTEVPADALAKQVEIFEAQLEQENKPKAAWPKIIEGKKGKWYTEVCLVDQESVITPGKTVEQLRKEVSAELGGDVKLARFVRYERGEGIAKKSDDFAAEVAKMAGV